MTVATEASYAELTWTGAETAFNPGFSAMDVAHVVVRYRDHNGNVTTLSAGTHISLAKAGLVGEAGAISAAPLSLPAAPGTVIFERVTPATQTVNFADLTKYSAVTHTKLHDAAAMRSAELKRRVVTGELSVDLATEQAAIATTKAEAAAASQADVATRQSDVITRETHVVALEASAVAANTAAQNAAQTAQDQAAAIIGTSVTALTIGTGPHSLTTQANKHFEPGNWILLTSDSDPANRWMHGPATAYNVLTGALTVDVRTVAGVGSRSDWTLHIAGVGLSPADLATLAQAVADAQTARDAAIAAKVDAQAGATTATTQAGIAATKASDAAGSAAAAAGYAAALASPDYGFVADAPTDTRDYGSIP